MRLSRTRLRFVVALVAVGLVTAGTAAAVTVSQEDVTDAERSGETITATATLTELYQNPNLGEWAVAGETDLENPTWTITFLDQQGQQIRQVQVNGQTLDPSALDDPSQLRVSTDASPAPATVRVSVTGTVPSVEEYTYPELGDEGSAESFLVMRVSQDQGEGGADSPVEEWRAQHFTDDSREARQALDDAKAALEEARAAGLDVGEAESDFQNARSAYVNENFDNAVSLAEDAEQSANAALAAQESDGIPPTLVAAVVVVVLVVAGVGIYFYRQGQGGDTKLR